MVFLSDTLECVVLPQSFSCTTNLVVFLKTFLSVTELFPLTAISSYFQHFLMHVHNYTFHISENNNDLTGS